MLKEQTISIGKTIALKNSVFRTIFTMLLAIGDARRQIAATKHLVGSHSFNISAERSIKSKSTPISNIAFGNPWLVFKIDCKRESVSKYAIV